MEVMMDQFSASIRSDDPFGGAWWGFGYLPRLWQDRPEHPGLVVQFIKKLAVVSFEFFTVASSKAGTIGLRL